MRCWRAENFACAGIYTGHHYPIWCMDESPTGVYMATGSKDQTARLWSLEREHPLITYIGHTQDVEVKNIMVLNSKVGDYILIMVCLEFSISSEWQLYSYRFSRCLSSFMVCQQWKINAYILRLQTAGVYNCLQSGW